MLSFDKEIDRSQNNAAKLEEMVLHFGTNEPIPLWIADMDFRTAQPIVDAIQKRAEQGIFGYTNRPEEYFQSYADWQARRNGWRPDTALMSFAPGVIPAMFLMLRAMTSPTDPILIQPPVYHPFTDVVLDLGRPLLCNQLKKAPDGRYQVDFEDFEEQCKKRPKFFILCNPHNPVGRCWTKEELLRMGNLCIQYGVQIISDEIHSDLILSGHRHVNMAAVSPEIGAITTTCLSVSKTFNLAGLQSATVIFPNAELQAIYMKDLRQHDIARNNCFSLVATMAAYREGEGWLEELLRYVEGNLDFVREYCQAEIPLLRPNKPECTYLSWIDASALGMDDQALSDFMIHKAGVAMNRGDSFGAGGSGYLRLNAACPRSVLERALGKIKAAVAGR